MLHNPPSSPAFKTVAVLPQEKNMNASLSWYNLEGDVIRNVDRAVHAERFALIKTKFLEIARVLPKAGMSWCITAGVTFVVGKIDAHATDLASKALWFEGAKPKFMKHIVVSGVPVGDEIRPHFEKFDAVYSRLVKQCEENIKVFRELNERSRLADAFERLLEAATSLRTSSRELVDIADQSLKHGEALAELHRLGKGFDFALSHYAGEEEFDPQIVSLATDALERMRVEQRAH